jgi:LysR family transcriptional regulator, benzoate and cis,cis-muconate-responsive activator of ben and cat genes
MVELRHLRYFVATADAGTVSAAADAVHVTQPALSRQLRQLEHDLGVDLFDRSPGRVTLSRVGLALLPQIRELLAGVDALTTSAAYHARGHIERLRIAAPTVTLTDVVSPFVATMSPADPVVDVRVGDGMTTAEMLVAGADLAIGTRRPPPPYQSIRLADLPVWAYVLQADPWHERRWVSLDMLLTRPLIGVPVTFAAREVLESALTARDQAPVTLVEAANGTIAQALAASGRGVAVVSDDPRFDLRPLAIHVDGKPLSIRLNAAWSPHTTAANTVREVAHRLSTWVERHYGAAVP